MGLDRDSLKALCDSALIAIRDYWPEPETGVPALPERQNVSNGEVYWDCEELCVAVERIFPHQGDITAEIYTEDAALGGFRGIIMAVWLLRCVPDLGEDGMPPTADAIDLSAVDVLGDSITITNLLLEAQTRNELASCNQLAFQDWTPAGPMGGFGGGVTRFRVGLL